MHTTRKKQSSELQCVALHEVMTVVLEANVYRKLVIGHKIVSRSSIGQWQG